MPVTSDKQRLVNQVFSSLRKHTDVKEGKNGKAPNAEVLEQFVYAICREGTTTSEADRAFQRLCDNFFDWNEIRVSSIREIADSLGHLAFAEVRAQKIIRFLQEVFETTFSFDLEGLHKKGLKLAAKQLNRFEVADNYNVSWVVQRSLGGHSLPLDSASHRVVRRLGLVDDDADAESLRCSLEHQIPKAKGSLFTDLISYLAVEYCQETPACHRCPLSSQCPKIIERETVATNNNGAARN